MKIVILDNKTLGKDVSIEGLKGFGELVTYETTTYEETLNRVKDSQIVITNKVVIDKEIIDNSDIKLICVAATGMNNIDLEYAKQKGIEVKNVAGYSTSSVVQLTLSFVLQFVQKIDFYDNYGKEHWKDSPIFTNLDKPFYELDGKTWGIIGLGEIGRGVAKVASAFNTNVQYYSTSGKNNNNEYKNVSLEELLTTSDIITIHAPLNEQTLNLLNKDNLQKVKKGTMIINLGRGGIVNEQDITDTINSGQDIYYGTDVVSKEPILKENPLLSIENKDRLMITPHIAWASIEARKRLIAGIESNIREFLK